MDDPGWYIDRYPRLCNQIRLTTAGRVSEWEAAKALAAGPYALVGFDRRDHPGGLFGALAWKFRRGMRHNLRQRNFAYGAG
jgi:hypothetical protein